MISLRLLFNFYIKSVLFTILISIIIIALSCFALNALESSRMNYTYSNAVSVTDIQSFTDKYADEVVIEFTKFTSDSINSLGAPDGIYAQIFSDYSNGLLTLDMGRYEAIINEDGDDFTVLGGIGEHSVKVNNNLSQPFIFLGYGLSNSSFDLNSIGYVSTRYVQIEYRTGDLVEIDVVEATHYNIQTYEPDAPIITLSLYHQTTLCSFFTLKINITN